MQNGAEMWKSVEKPVNTHFLPWITVENGVENVDWAVKRCIAYTKTNMQRAQDENDEDSYFTKFMRFSCECLSAADFHAIL